MPISKCKQLRRVKKKFIRFKFQLRGGNKSKYYHQGLADGKASYGRRYNYVRVISNHIAKYGHWSEYMKGILTMKIIVAGGRDFFDRERMEFELENLLRKARGEELWVLLLLTGLMLLKAQHITDKEQKQKKLLLI